jgi:cell division cycle protein 37
METATQRIRMLERDLKKIETRKKEDSDSDDDDLDDTEAIKIEMEELKAQNQANQAKLDEYEKNKKWNVDNMFEVKEERTLINESAGKSNYTPTGFAQSTVSGEDAKKQFAADEEKAEKATTTTTSPMKPEEAAAASAKPAAPKKKKAVVNGPAKPEGQRPTPDPHEVDSDPNFVYSYHEFTERYADLVEEFMAIPTFDASKDFLLKHGDIMLQEHCCNYLLLASLEDEMNGYRDKMKQTAKQSQIISNIAELAKSWNTHPGNVILPFFQRMEQREFLEGFLSGTQGFAEKIISRAIVKKAEIDKQQREESPESGVQKEGVDLNEIPKEERLGPGGLDPLEVIETLPIEMQEAFESRDVEVLKQCLLDMDPKDAEYHMKRCVDSGLWQAQA